ncbi:PREDICTED: SKP1-like protein 18 [Ipomoea nil]|uniref:SKP1-like protein 18 n=1 Tax=Ipomoea nil TaxID=35883 RepID=UPI0009012B1A|nr:PREDICTED: SKP1-like protein 18 [Ipomoea nil]
MASSSEQNNKPLLMLMSSDGEQFTEEKSMVVQFCRNVKTILDSSGAAAADGIFVRKVDAKNMALVLEYCKHHFEKDSSKDPDVQGQLKRFDAEFVEVDLLALCRLILAAYFLGVKKLLAVACEEFSGRVNDRCPPEIREILDTLYAHALQDDDEAPPFKSAIGGDLGLVPWKIISSKLEN